ncbi:Ankyrin repeat domain containing protein 34C [Dissostichus eleginoides]|uniref:Ankyrin repeat domain containing protein 34C n=1 Tax=Dissostichus eleginoides TaxID=100907 RepID=A0AAD9FE15_DISEL|nr:Ankyrin repeat domain containing protein 34C [Dissostichus eleginoides]
MGDGAAPTSTRATTAGETPVCAACLAARGPAGPAEDGPLPAGEGRRPQTPGQVRSTALIHACAERGPGGGLAAAGERGGPQPQGLLGSSALVHAINKGDRDTLQVLLDACKAKGKEVIIITSDTSPSGTKKTKQYLNAPPSPAIVDKLAPDCMSPSDVEIRTSSPAGDQDGIFSFALTTALPLPSARPPGERGRPPQAAEEAELGALGSGGPSVLVLTGDGGLVAPSVLVPPRDGGLEDGGCSSTIFQMNGLSLTDPVRPRLSRRHSIETHDPCSPKLMDRSVSEDYAPLSGASWADKVQQHQILYRRNTAPETQENAGGPGGARALIHPKLTRMEHYESDTHLCPESSPGSPDSGRVSVDRRRFNASPLSLLSPRESLENIPSSVSPVLRRRGLLERRGSGTLLLDHISHTRPGFLPPLNINPQRPIPDIRANGKPTSPVHAGPKILVPVAPASPKRGPDFKMKKKLMRRHSMQTEQMKQLSTFQEVLAERVLESSGD